MSFVKGAFERGRVNGLKLLHKGGGYIHPLLKNACFILKRFEDTKGVIRNMKSNKGRHVNGK
jgi:hypothetical protein